MAPAADASYKQQKRRLFADAGLAGARVLEIGPGTGVNMRHYRAVLDGEPGAELASLTLAEPNEFMHKDLEAAAHEAGFNGDTLRITNESATALAAEDGSYDVVVSTLVLCSVPDPKLAIDEIWRVLAPGGRFVYLEHVCVRGAAAARGVCGALLVLTLVTLVLGMVLRSHGPPGTWERSSTWRGAAPAHPVGTDTTADTTHCSVHRRAYAFVLHASTTNSAARRNGDESVADLRRRMRCVISGSSDRPGDAAVITPACSPSIADVERDTGDWITEKDGWAVDGEIYTSSEGPPFVRSHAVGIATKQRSRL